jgi:hypothetical protein
VKLNKHPYPDECLISILAQNANVRPVDVLYEGDEYTIFVDDASVVI